MKMTAAPEGPRKETKRRLRNKSPYAQGIEGSLVERATP